MDALISLWQQLEAQPHIAGRFEKLPCPVSSPPGLYAGLLGTEAGTLPRRMLLLRLPRTLVDQVSPNYRYQGLSIEPLESSSGPDDAYISLVLNDAHLTDVFTALAGDIVNATAAHITPPARMQAFLQRLSLWEALLAAFSTDGLSITARQGLYGELYLLRYLLQQGIAPGAAIGAWVGPLREPQDFILPGSSSAVEVKTLGPGNTTIRVSSARQLDDSPFGQLWLAALYLGTDDSQAETLPALVDRLQAMLAGEPAAASLLTLRLGQAGYFQSQAIAYQSTGYTVASWQLLRVRDDFPRLRAADLPDAIPALSYSLDLTGLARFYVPPTQLITSF
jgi:hypothetical protein